MILTDYELPAWAELTMQITSVITLILIVIGCLLLLAYFVWADIETTKLRNEFLKNCTEHDRAVIAEYKATTKYPKVFRRKK